MNDKNKRQQKKEDPGLRTRRNGTRKMVLDNIANLFNQRVLLTCSTQAAHKVYPAILKNKAKGLVDLDQHSFCNQFCGEKIIL